MGGTKIGGIKARDKNLAKDPDFYVKIGAKGGKLGKTGGFGNGEEGRRLASIAGRKGGQRSSRSPLKKIVVVETPEKSNPFKIFKRKG